GQRQVLARDHPLIGAQVVVTLDVLALRPEPRSALAGEPGERDVHVVGSAAHDADTAFGDATEAAMPALQVVDGSRDHVADADRLPRLRVPREGSGRGTGVAIADTR